MIYHTDDFKKKASYIRFSHSLRSAISCERKWSSPIFVTPGAPEICSQCSKASTTRGLRVEIAKNIVYAMRNL